MQTTIFRRILTQSNQLRTSSVFPTSALRSTQFQSLPSSSGFSTSVRFNASEADRGSFEAPYSEASVPLYDRLAMHPVSFWMTFLKTCRDYTSRTISIGFMFYDSCSVENIACDMTSNYLTKSCYQYKRALNQRRFRIESWHIES